MKDNKVLVVLVVVLALALIGETAYLMNVGKKDVRKGLFSKERLAKMDRDLKTAKPRIKQQYPRLAVAPKAVEPIDPLREMERMQREMDRMFQDNFAQPQPRASVNFGAGGQSLNPQMNIRKTDAAYIIQMDVPGMKKEDINIDVQQNMLMVSGQRKYEVTEEEKGAGFVGQTKENQVGFFSRSIPLPPDVKKDEIKANCENGVLSITLPRVVMEKPVPEQPTKIKIE